MKKISFTIIRTKNFVARAIHLGMYLWSLFRGLPQKKCFNHCEVRYGFSKNLKGGYTIGAIGSGTTKRPWNEYVNSKKGKYFEHKDYVIELSDKDYHKVMEKLTELIGTPYEYQNFWWHLIKIITGKWKGSKTTKETNCYEVGLIAVSMVEKYGDVNIFMNPYEAEDWANENIG